MSSTTANNVEQLRGVTAEEGGAGGPVEMRGVGAAAGEWPAQQAEMIPVEENSLVMALGRVPRTDMGRIVQGIRTMEIDEEAYDARMNAEAVAFVERILRSRREGNEPPVVVAEQPRFINNLPMAIHRIDDDDQELADLVDSSVSFDSSLSSDDDDIERRERMMDIRPHDATMGLGESPERWMPEEFGIVVEAEARRISVSSTDMDGFDTAPDTPNSYETADDTMRDEAFIETDSDVSAVNFHLAAPETLMLHGGLQLNADSSNDGDISCQSSYRSGSSQDLSTLNNAFVQPESMVHEDDESQGTSAPIHRNLEAQEVVRRRGVKRQYVESEDDVKAPEAKRRRQDPMDVADVPEVAISSNADDNMPNGNVPQNLVNSENPQMNEFMDVMDVEPMDIEPGTDDVLENVPTEEGMDGEPNDEEAEVMDVADPQQPIPDIDDEEFPAIAGLDFQVPEVDDVADHRDEAEMDDEESEDEDDGSDEEEDEDLPHNVNLEERNMADVLRQQLPTLVTQQDINCCTDQRLTQNAMHAALMEEVSKANVVEDGVILMHPSVYVDANAGHQMTQHSVHEHIFFRNARWVVVPMLNNSGTPSEHWSIGCLNIEQRDLIVYDSQVPVKSVKDERIGVMRRIMSACIGANEAQLLRIRYSYRNRCNQQAVGEEREDGIFCIYHARRWLKGDIVVTNNGTDDCDLGAERQRLRVVLESLRNELQGYLFRPMATPPPVFHLPPPPQAQQPYHVVRRDHRVTQGRIRDCYMRLNARA